MVFVTGDCHANWKKFSIKSFPIQRELTRDDYVIVCGDFGLWHKNKTEQWWLKWFTTKKFTILFVDGNHENFDRLYSKEFEVVDFHGGKAHKIRENVYHLMRGYVFELCGKKFFTFGGASSHDIDDGILDMDDFESAEAFVETYRQWCKQNKMFRVNHYSWWSQELPSQDEMDFGLKTLEEHDYKVDYVISHCLPQAIAVVMGYRGADILTMYFNKLIENGLEFKEWYAGHYHRNERVLGKYYVLYEDILRIV